MENISGGYIVNNKNESGNSNALISPIPKELMITPDIENSPNIMGHKHGLMHNRHKFGEPHMPFEPHPKNDDKKESN